MAFFRCRPVTAGVEETELGTNTNLTIYAWNVDVPDLNSYDYIGVTISNTDTGYYGTVIIPVDKNSASEYRRECAISVGYASGAQPSNYNNTFTYIWATLNPNYNNTGVGRVSVQSRSYVNYQLSGLNTKTGPTKMVGIKIGNTPTKVDYSITPGSTQASTTVTVSQDYSTADWIEVICNGESQIMSRDCDHAWPMGYQKAIVYSYETAGPFYRALGEIGNRQVKIYDAYGKGLGESYGSKHNEYAKISGINYIWL